MNADFSIAALLPLTNKEQKQYKMTDNFPNKTNRQETQTNNKPNTKMQFKQGKAAGHMDKPWDSRVRPSNNQLE